jgi:3-hydroxyisobutyrate dehydrogenase-like beta-hydroxyacid dehydrogenase
MARNYAPGRHLFVYDLNAQAARQVAADVGATALSCLDPVPDRVRTVILMLPSSGVVEAVLHRASSPCPPAPPTGSVRRSVLAGRRAFVGRQR